MNERYDIYLRNKKIDFINPHVCGRQSCAPGHSSKSIRRFWLIHYIVSGKGVFKTAGKTYELSENEIFIIRPDELYEYTADLKDPWQYKWVGFSGEYADKLNNTDKRVMKTSGHLFEDMQHAEDYGDMCEEYIALKVMELLCEILCTASKKTYAETAKNIVDSDYNKKISVAQIAKQIGIDKNYLSKMFKQKYGLSLQKYIIEKRMKEARHFLHVGYNVGEVSQLVGYDDCFSFSRAYKNLYGVAPKTEKRTSI